MSIVIALTLMPNWVIGFRASEQPTSGYSFFQPIEQEKSPKGPSYELLSLCTLLDKRNVCRKLQIEQ